MYKRILLKLTGELFGGGRPGIDEIAVNKIAQYIGYLKNNYQTDLAIVVGGGNLFRGRNVQRSKSDSAQADFTGMLGTIMNGLELQGKLNDLGIESRVMSSLHVDQACEPYIRLRAKRHLEKDRIVVLVGGLGIPFLTTDSAAAQFAAQLDCEVLLKGSTIDGVYSADPKKDSTAMKYSTLTFQEALVEGLMVMDGTAFAACMESKIPIIIFDVRDLNNIELILKGEKVGTLIT